VLLVAIIGGIVFDKLADLGLAQQFKRMISRWMAAAQ